MKAYVVWDGVNDYTTEAETAVRAIQNVMAYTNDVGSEKWNVDCLDMYSDRMQEKIIANAINIDI